jgi:GNAT superfamily N-acetyltransferase
MMDHLHAGAASVHHVAVIDIRPATLHDLPGAYRVCLRTGDAGGDATGRYRNPDLLGHVYAGPYVVGEPSHALIAADEDGVAGYCLAAPDTSAFAAWAASAWWPQLRDQFPRRDDGTPDAEIIALIHEPPIANRDVLEAYPAHLHIDLLERVRGTGTGRRLVERQLQSLADAGASGCHLFVDASNANAIAFYGHLGWEVLQRTNDAWVMGVSLR